jgi:glucose/arabinose dehydrogenase
MSMGASLVPAMLAAGFLASPGCMAAEHTVAIRHARGLALETVVSGLTDPVYLTAPAGDPRLFVVQQDGRIRIVRDGHLLPRPFLDLVALVGYGGERGLLSMAFHPHYAQNGWFFVNYTNRDGDTRIERFRVGSDPDLADPSSRQLVLEIQQPYANHNGGHILFGPDGMLYIGMGDGGSGGDPHGNGQNRANLLGDLLRIDVDGGSPYAVPADNPFAHTPGMRGEIWAWGLRNPWRFCFDAQDGLLYIADVGQNRWEEIDVVGARESGLNFGWNRMEGAHCYRTPCDPKGLVEPVVEYGHGDGCSITGGFVYRGTRLPGMSGHYFYADYCQGWIRSFLWRGGQLVQHRQWDIPFSGSILSFGLDAAGELYVLTGNGRVSRLVWKPSQ